MITSVLRFEKIKSFTAINLSESHVYRYSETPNANAEKTHLNSVLIGKPNISSRIKKTYENLNIKPRKNAVLAMDCILSLSNGAFKNEGNIEEFHKSAKNFLEKTFKGRCISAVIHLDETTPHVHAVILPLEKKGGKWKLNARKLFSKTTLSQYQKKYYEHMKLEFQNLSPPNFGEKAKHNKISSYYRAINDSKPSSMSRKIELRNLNDDINESRKKSIDELNERQRDLILQ